jgi:hypothetical protein
MKQHLKLLDTASAKAAGFRPLTIGYQLPQERPMLDNVLADMRRGNINHCLVESNGGVSVWRGGIATGQHLTPALSSARRGSKRSIQPAAGKAAHHRKGKRS